MTTAAAAELQDRERRLARLQAAKAQLEQENGPALEPRHQKSVADPAANMMRVGNDGRASSAALALPAAASRSRGTRTLHARAVPRAKT